MTAITIVPADVRIVLAPPGSTMSLPVSEPITAGEYVRHDSTTGYARLGNASSLSECRQNSYLAANVAGDGTIQAAQRGAILELGDALDALDIDDKVYVADADGGLADTPGTVEYVAGIVIPGFMAGSPHNLLRLTLGDPIIDTGVC